DINLVTFITEGSSATNPLPDANQSSGTVGMQQAVSLPAAGIEVPFRVLVIDRRGNRSNELDGVYVAPN
ncbi:MAG TPA: hypothetical protein VM617_05870, partial [Thermoanaerobaculia bacterium]|nr:hypothetical protein [Thermoanaerobaculia bacterium]